MAEKELQGLPNGLQDAAGPQATISPQHTQIKAVKHQTEIHRYEKKRRDTPQPTAAGRMVQIKADRLVLRFLGGVPAPNKGHIRLRRFKDLRVAENEIAENGGVMLIDRKSTR